MPIIDNGFKSLKEVRELVCVSVFELKSAEEIAELVTSNQLDWINCENNVEISFSPRQIQIQDIIKQAKQVIESEKKVALAQLKDQVASLSIQMAQKVMKNELSDEKRQTALINDYLKSVTLN